MVAVELAGPGEDDEGNLGITENGKLIRLLQEPLSSLRKCDLSVGPVLYPLHLYLPSSHDYSLNYDYACNYLLNPYSLFLSPSRTLI